ncbi:hypothetical protein M378DRAFT_156131 [Amanita muscaria Koide BX008]|uniref:Ras GTPase-activating-like protein rng2 n=1 Tax=Amanita muscaria (strain Koide BX008) TaxID=946122 RepID=A0A0C2XLV7_AMAMK|nr:hypothetical protein M378DRAFT_156131 [Amanita muscaria Koide BX008]
MDPTGSTSSNLPSKPGKVGQFAYQTRLLERTSSRGSSLARSNSQSSIGMELLSNPTGSSAVSARRWTPSHRVTGSLDVIRGKWEDRAKDDGSRDASASPTREGVRSPTLERVSPNNTSSTSRSNSPPLQPSPHKDEQKTPTYLKRRTMPAPIIASPLSPNSTGTSTEDDSRSLTSMTNRTYLGSMATRYSSPSSSTKRHGTDYPTLNSTPSTDSNIGRKQRSNTLDTASSHDFPRTAPTSGDRTPISSNQNGYRDVVHPTAGKEYSPSVRRRPTSLYGSYHTSPLSNTPPHRPMSSLGNTSAFETAPTSQSQPTSPEKGPNPMFPSPYRSSYMSAKKSGTYGENLVKGGRNLGRHLPRIASGEETQVFESDKDEFETMSGVQHPPSKRSSLPPSSQKLDVPVPGADDVAGLPGRIQLKAPSAPASPSPSYKLYGAHWADTQRHLIQAYEYLCHVGEAQQWIEGCLGEELGFGVVEMEEGLRNGVVLAKLVRAFKGEAAVRRIYDAPKLDFRHSDNINYFFNFVREVGLPEGFIFELTDLYEKKNFPKVIYCIHALSHLLARRGLAQKIGNLLGRLHFSDDQLQRTQKGLKEAGVVMPNFGNVGRELAKEINEEVEVEVETEEERCDRLLLENEDSIRLVQTLARGYLTRKTNAVLHGRLRLTERHIVKLQAACRRLLVCNWLAQHRQMHLKLVPWAIGLQTAGRACVARRNWRLHLQEIRAVSSSFIKLQAQIRGLLQRRRRQGLKSALRGMVNIVRNVQAASRAQLAFRTHKEIRKTFSQIVISSSVIALQAHLRGVLMRKKVHQKLARLKRREDIFISLQAQCRAVIMRRRLRAQLARLEDVTHVVIRIQAAVRTFMARKRLLSLIRGLRKATPMVIGFQAKARANIARQRRETLTKALVEVKTVASVNVVQSFARAILSRRRHQETKRQLKFVMPDVVGFQAAARGALARDDFLAWRDHLRANHPVATILQAMLRGAMIRRSFRQKMEYYKANLSKVVKIQSLFRAKETREQYRQLTLGKNVTVGTIKNFVHLLDDSEADFQEEIKVERLRKRVMESIRENQSLENDISDLDVKIALVVQNAKSSEELVKARRRHGADNAASHAARMSLLAAHGDPFSGPNTLDKTARRKLELYQQLFYLLQIRGEYLSRLFLHLSADDTPEKNRRFTERVVLTLFGYGQDRREDYLLLKLFQLAIQEEIKNSSSIQQVIEEHPMYITVAVHFVRPKQITYVRDAFQSLIKEVINSGDLDLEVDPSKIHKARIVIEEMRAGVMSSQPKELPFREALQDLETRTIYIRHMQVLQWWTEAFVAAITQSTRRMPYSIRYLAKETLAFLREKFPDATEQAYASCIGRLVYYRLINPAIVTPETFDIVTNTIDPAARKNLAQISKVLTQITSGVEFDDKNPSYVPINDFVHKSIAQMSTWFIEVANVPDAESQFHAHEFMDATVQPKPIYISPNEIYTMHELISKHLDGLAPRPQDPLRQIMLELDGVPHLGDDSLKDARDIPVMLELTNRFAHVHDPHAEEKTQWVQAKRSVLAILRVQPARDLLESLMRPVTEEDEQIWDDVLQAEAENEQVRQIERRQPSTAVADSAYRLEDIRSLNFAAVKAHAIAALLELEKKGKISRGDGFQGILNAIANDVRSKHRKRLQRQQEMENMREALCQLAERKKYFQEQIDSYHNYVEAAMQTMQHKKEKKRFVIPFTKQYFHLRDLQKSGQSPKFGSYIYSAEKLYERGILLSIDQCSPRQFDKFQITMSSDTAGVFSLLLDSSLSGITTRVASEDVRMEDLLQAKYEKRASLSLFGGKVKVNFDLFLFQINKKFYA